jgi:two-component system, sensor histidine kinase and response regulator
MQDPERVPSATILVVDDNEANRALARETLEDEGYRVVLATNGLEGIQTFETVKPDCILLDIRMPDLDGFEVCRRIRKMPGGPETPIVFVTALRDVDTFDRAIVAGGDDFLTKPLRPIDLAHRVRTALTLRRVSIERSELYELLRGQRDDMLRALLQKEQLAAFLVHDLKNPVTGMAMAADIIAAEPSTPPRAKAAATRIRAHADTLQRMILNLLDLGKGDAGRLVPVRAPVELPSLFRDVRRAFEGRAASRSITLDLRADVAVIDADEALLRRVVENLVDNAIRHAPPRSAVVVSAIQSELDVVISIADAGPGVAADLRERIFDRYFRVDPSAQRDGGGRGLGLAFCKLAAEAHGGSIGVDDAEPGSVFWVRLPHAE